MKDEERRKRVVVNVPPRGRITLPTVVLALVRAGAGLTWVLHMMVWMLLPMVFDDCIHPIERCDESRTLAGLLGGWTLGVLLLIAAFYLISKSLRWWLEGLVLVAFVAAFLEGQILIAYWVRQPPEPFIEHMFQLY